MTPVMLKYAGRYCEYSEYRDAGDAQKMLLRLYACTLEMGRMSDYDIRPKPKVWASSPNECRTFGRTLAEFGRMLCARIN